MGSEMCIRDSCCILVRITEKLLVLRFTDHFSNNIMIYGVLLIHENYRSIIVINLIPRLTTRLWWIYHSMACFDVLQSSSVNSNGSVMNQFVKIWWWPLFRWFECNVRSGPLPNGFNLPLPAVCVKVTF